MSKALPAVFSVVRIKGDGWKLYHDECGYLGRLPRKTLAGAKRLLYARRQASIDAGRAKPMRIYGYFRGDDGRVWPLTHRRGAPPPPKYSPFRGPSRKAKG
jgi:hypothetical protein